MENQDANISLKKKPIDWLIDQFKFSTYEIAITGLIIALWIVSYKFISINLVVTRIGITHAIAILVGLIFKPLQGVLIGIIADTICIGISSRGFSMWMIEYAIIYPGIILTTWGLKFLLFREKEIAWYITTITIILLTLAITLYIAIANLDFRKGMTSSNPDNFFDMTSKASQIVVGVFCGLFFVWAIVVYSLYIFKFKNNKRLREHISFVVITTAIIILFSWIWGTYAQIRFVRVKFGNTKASTELMYLYFIPRVLKTPLLLFIYPAIAIPLYRVNEIISKKSVSW